MIRRPSLPLELNLVIVLFYINCAVAGAKFIQSITQGVDFIPLLLCIIYFNTAMNLTHLRPGWDDAALAILIAQAIARAVGMVWTWMDPAASYWSMFGLPFLTPSPSGVILLLGIMFLLAVLQIIILLRPKIRLLFHQEKKGKSNLQERRW